jgi:recombination protein RecT
MTQAVARRDTVVEVATQIAGEEMRTKIEQAVGNRELAIRIQRAALTSVQTNPDLLAGNVSRSSFYNALLRCAQDGLLPDGREAAFVRRKNEVVYQPMVGGFRKRAAESGFSLTAQVVFAGDEFDYELGTAPRLTHKPPNLDIERGDPIGAYAVATHAEHGTFIEVMSKGEIEQVRKSATTDAVWRSWWSEMARKTVARRLFKQLPLGAFSTRVTSMLEADELAFGPLGALPEVDVTPELEVVEGEVEQETFVIPDGAA